MSRTRRHYGLSGERHGEEGRNRGDSVTHVDDQELGTRIEHNCVDTVAAIVVVLYRCDDWK
jgi:hypothetical protein